MNVDIVDENDDVIGQMPIQQAITSGNIYRVARMIVTHKDGRLFVHKRSKRMIPYPEHYDVGAAGVVDVGETYEECAKRELQEELGINNANITPLFNFKYRKEYRTNTHVFLIQDNGPFTLQETEISWGAFMAIAEIKELMRKEPFHPGGKFVFEKFEELQR